MTIAPTLRRLLMLAFLAVLATAGSAHGHAEVEDSGFRRNAAGTVIVHIQHGCGAESAAAGAVDRVVVLVPRIFPSARPTSVSGWQAASKLTPDGHRLEWRRVARRSTVQDFGIRVRFPAKAGVYGLPTVQYCGTSSIAWIQRPAAGADAEHPLPTVTVR
jgi:uncharacterized protein YcnI